MFAKGNSLPPGLQRGGFIALAPLRVGPSQGTSGRTEPGALPAIPESGRPERIRSSKRSQREHLQSSRTTEVAPEQKPTESPRIPPHPSPICPFRRQPRAAGPSGAAPLYYPPGRLCRAPHLPAAAITAVYGDVCVLGANSRGYCCRHPLAGPTLIKEPGLPVTAPALGPSARGGSRCPLDKIKAAAGQLMAPQPKASLRFRAALDGANGRCWRAQLHPGAQGRGLCWWHWGPRAVPWLSREVSVLPGCSSTFSPAKAPAHPQPLEHQLLTQTHCPACPLPAALAPARSPCPAALAPARGPCPRPCPLPAALSQRCQPSCGDTGRAGSSGTHGVFAVPCSKPALCFLRSLYTPAFVSRD